MMLYKMHKRMARGGLAWLIFFLLAGSLSAPAQPVDLRPPAGEASARDESAPSGVVRAARLAADAAVPVLNPSKKVTLNYKDSPLDMILDDYSEWTGRTLIKSPSVPKINVTLRSFTELTVDEALVAIDSMLSMNNITLVPMGDKFFRVVATANARTEGMPLSVAEDDETFADTDKLITRLIRLQHIPPAEAQPLLQSILHGYGKMQTMEQINSILVTDTSANLLRIQEVLKLIDLPIELKIQHRIYTIQHAKASDIASKLNEIIQTSQETTGQAAAKTVPTRAAPPGVIRAREPSAEGTTAAEVTQELAEKGIAQGTVKIISDERTNIMIIISDPVNFKFFDEIVAILDVPTDPEITVKVVKLEYAEAEEISGTLNEFIGVAKAEENDAAAGAATAGQPGAAQGQTLRDYAIQRAQARAATVSAEEKAKIGQLSPDTKILADKRTNSLLLMGRRADIAALMDVIAELDVMLAQVIIETVILEVSLSKNLSYGVDWLQKSMTIVNENKLGPRGGIRVTEPVMSYGGGWATADREVNAFKDGSQIQRDSISLTGGALSYYLTLFDLNVDAIIRMAAASSDARVLSTPVILTTDNTEAKIIAGEERPIVTSTTTSTEGAQTSQYEYKNIGLELTVTPHINPKGFVVMEVTQTADNLLDPVQIDGNEVPVISKRELTAEIAVNDRSTIVLGGLVNTRDSKGRTKVPVLGDIPLLGTFFRSDSSSDTRSELVILITPYVLLTPEDALRETDRIHRASRASKTPWPKNWSESLLATPDPKDREAVLQAERNAADLKAIIEKRAEEIRSEGLDTSRGKPADVIEVKPVSAIPPPEAMAPAEADAAAGDESSVLGIPDEEKEAADNETVIADGMVMYDIVPPAPDAQPAEELAPEVADPSGEGAVTAESDAVPEAE